jgi:hypothetical protein
MEIKGDITIKRTGIFERRADQGLRAASITTEEELTRHSAYWQSLESTSGNDSVVMPDVSELPDGWQVVLHNTGDTLMIVNSGSDVVTTIAAGEAKRLTFLNDESFFVEEMTTAEAAAAQRYTLTHDNTTSWGAPSAGYYAISTSAATHGRGTRPVVQFYETVGGDEIEVTPDQSKFATSDGAHTFRVPQDPDLRYTGKVIFV